MTTSRFVVGIDLGTSNSALAYIDTAEALEPGEHHTVVQFAFDQVVSPGSCEPRPLLPSGLYVRGESELPEGSLNLPWAADPGYCLGQFAREQGAKVPGRYIHSSKSWLCHPGVDREARILPPAAADEAVKRSPVEVAELMLRHMRDAWNWSLAKGDAGLALEEQQVVLCVPASFDAAARTLTVRAAKAAGLEKITLLEEPQAAFYSWIQRAGEDWRRRVRVGDVVLVVDVGGGTTDFSLIAVTEEEGSLQLRRLAVGEHILLGGDNMDLALAYGVAQRLEQERQKKLDPQQFAMLTQQCRQAKEALLTDATMGSHPLTILGRGSSVIGGTIKTELRRDDFEQMLVDGFFPKCGIGDRPARAQRAGFRSAGLPYASDPAITLHLASFLSRQHEAVEETFADRAKGPVLPTAILFNGGVFKADPLRQRVEEVIGSWCREAGGEAPRVLEGADLDLAVARGAACQGVATRGRGVRIRGGSARSYYIGIEPTVPAVPGVRPQLKAFCVVPYGMEEGTSLEIPGREIDLCIWTGEPAQFRFLSSTVRRHDAPGTLRDVIEDEFEEHQAIETTLPAGGAGEGRPAEVDLRSHLTEIGTLELACVERGATKEWKLEFQVRASEGRAPG